VQDDAPAQPGATAQNLARHDRPRRGRQDADDSAEPDDQDSEAQVAPAARGVGGHAAIDRLQRPATPLDRVAPIAAALAPALAADHALARGRGLRLLAALIVVGVAVVAMSLLALVEPDSDYTPADAGAETAAPEKDAPERRTP
jgi:hypothetical protein